jgi:ComF family protein
MRRDCSSRVLLRPSRLTILLRVGNRLIRGLLSLVVPPVCVACREPELGGGALCPGCEDGLVALGPHVCLRCGAPAPAAVNRCRECGTRAFAFERAWSAFAYQGTARALVLSLKARGYLKVAGLMASLVAARAPKGLLAGPIVPIPASPARRRREGFDHTLEIARALGHGTGLPVLDCLHRSRAVRPQHGLERRDRLRNARGSIAVRPDVAAVTERAVLLDDVYTTGATLDAGATALRAAGVHEVSAVSFARSHASVPVRWARSIPVRGGPTWCRGEGES